MELLPMPVGGPTGVRVSGDLDLESAPCLQMGVCGRYGTSAARRGEYLPFLIDLSQVTFLDSSGLHALETIGHQLSRRGWRLRLEAPVAQGPNRLLQLAIGRGWLTLLTEPERELSPAPGLPRPRAGGRSPIGHAGG